MKHIATTPLPPANPMWCVHITSSDGAQAAPSLEEANRLASAMREYIIAKKTDAPHAADLGEVNVVLWPGDRATFEEDLRDWDVVCKHWGLQP